MKYYKIEILEDNYIWVLAKENTAIAIDCGDADALINFVNFNQLDLTHVLVTHYHGDHTSGLTKIKKETKSQIVAGYKTNKLLLNNVIDKVIETEDDFTINNIVFSPVFAEGHSEDSVLYFLPEYKWLFSGDVLFTLGCGRAFFNTELLFNSLNKIKIRFPLDTLIFPGHNYLEANLNFLEQINYFSIVQKISNFSHKVVTPSLLEYELLYNPFLNSDNIKFKKLLEKDNLNNLSFFSYVRKLRSLY